MAALGCCDGCESVGFGGFEVPLGVVEEDYAGFIPYGVFVPKEFEVPTLDFRNFLGGLEVAAGIVVKVTVIVVRFHKPILR